MNWRRYTFPLVLMAALLLLFGCQQAAPAPAPTQVPAKPAAAAPAAKEAAKAPTGDRSNWPDRVRVAGGPQGGSFFVFSSAWGNLLREKLNLNTSVEVTQGASANATLVEDKKAELSIVSASVHYEGWTGAGWAKGTKYLGARNMIASESSSLQFWTLADRGIKTINDLNGKRVNLSQAGSGADLVGRKLFEITGIKPARITNVSHSDANQQLIDGLLDATFSQGGVPQPAITELSATKDVVVVEFTKEAIAKLGEVYPTFVPSEIPSGSYRGQTAPIPTCSDWFTLVARSDMPESFVYEVTKATLEGKPQLVAAYKSVQLMAPENVKFIKVPLHSGAAKYYQEKGLAIPKEAQPVN